MSPGTADGGPPAGPAVASAAPLVAFAKVLLGDMHAAQDQLVVEHCPVPGCNYAHRHVVPAGLWRQPLLKAPRCKPWLRYRVEVVSVVPVPATVAGSRRRAGAA